MTLSVKELSSLLATYDDDDVVELDFDDFVDNSDYLGNAFLTIDNEVVMEESVLRSE